MTSRERIRRIVAREPADRCGFWLGNPHPETLPILHAYFDTKTLDELQVKLGDDFRWITPQYMETTYRHPEGKGLFDIWKSKKSLGDSGPLARCESVEEVDAYEWPDASHLHFEECLAALRATGTVYRASGFWMPFFHDVMDLFGMEEYMTKMMLHPEVVEAVTRRVCEFYFAANERFYREAGEEADALFFGNDFGTQRDLLLSTEQFDAFVMPWLTRFTDQAHGAGLQVVLHSCGSVFRVIDRLIAAGVNCLHPLQALAHDMNAELLAETYGGKIAFLGGVDTQQLLVKGTPTQIKDEVRRLKRILGPHFIVSPSHEALLPNIPPQNVAAMAEAAVE